MKQVCLQCWREAPVGNLWCQESYCATDDKPTILEYGEVLGELNIIKIVSIMPAATIYEAERRGQKVLVKVAHAGFEERFKREISLLFHIQSNKSHHPALPLLLPAYSQANLRDYPYGKAISADITRYYAVFTHIGGETLRDVLLKNSQPWYQHSVWMTLALCDVISLMHQYGRLHLCLSPEMVLVHYDRDEIPRLVLLDLGAAAKPEEIIDLWHPRFGFPAYLSPELVQPSGRSVGAYSDVYSLGLNLYELLAGYPAYTFRLKSNAEVLQNVLNKQPAGMNRPDLTKIPEIVQRSISKEASQRQADVQIFAGELQSTVPPLPKERKSRRFSLQIVVIILAAALAIILLLVIAASLGS
jgi:serine/threonine protein kinase